VSPRKLGKSQKERTQNSHANAGCLYSALKHGELNNQSRKGEWLHIFIETCQADGDRREVDFTGHSLLQPRLVNRIWYTF